jgi:S1-C subfamily serine protease
LKIGDQAVTNREEMDTALEAFKPGDDMQVEVKRGEETVTVHAQIGT